MRFLPNEKPVFKLFLLLFTLLFIVCFSSKAQVSGVVFSDYNANGVKENTTTFNENGLSGVVVNAFDPSGNSLTVTYTGMGSATNSTGQYAVSGGSLGQIRLEFILPDIYSYASNGATGGTTVMFPTGATQNLAVHNPARYCQADPRVIANCYVGGNQAGADDVLVSFPYSSTGNTPTITHDAAANEIGTTWGIAYHRKNQKIYAGAFIKRHCGLGTGGIGAIYEIDATGVANPSLWLDIESFPGVDAGTIGTNAARGLALPTNSSQDATAFDKVGKEGIGDIDISDDGKTLYVMNLFQKEVLVIDIATQTLLQRWAIADPGCGANGTYRPFAIKYFKGEVYIGLVCSGESSGAIGNFFILKRSGASWSTVLSHTLNYPKGWVHATYASPPTVCSSFESWTSNFAGIHAAGSSTAGPRWCRPQPILSDIEFDVDGSMLIGFIDRAGHQLGYQQPNLDGSANGNGYVGGEILRAALVNGNYVLESGGTTASGGGCGANNQGPGGGEYYCGERFSNIHEEIAIGGLALLSGRNQVLSSAMDPGNTVFSGGLIQLNNTTGQKDNYYQLFVSSGPSTFGKAAGIGDVELLCNPAPVEIGNRVWLDLDRDGIQDAGETGLANITVELWSADGTTLIASTTTNGNGQYVFTSTAFPLIQPETSYLVRIPNVQGGSKQVNLSNYVPTTPNNDPGTNGDNRDSDGLVSGNHMQVLFNTTAVPGAGANNHSFDFGFIAPFLDAALAKTILSPTVPVQLGDVVTFRIAVTNQGTDPLDSIRIVDYIPGGLTFNAGSNPSWTGTAPEVYHTATIANGLLPVGGIAPGGQYIVNLLLSVNGAANASNLDNFAEITGVRDVLGNENNDDIDSSPDNNPNNDPGGQINSPADNYVDGDGTGVIGDGVAATDEDDHDGARVRFTDLSLVKDISPFSLPPYAFGSPIEFIISVSNQSNEPVQNIEIEDNLPAGYTFTPNNGWIESMPGLLTRTIPGPLNPGANASVSLVLTPIGSTSPNAWRNEAQIARWADTNGDPIGIYDFDSSPGNGPSNGTEDDDDNAVIEIFDLALRKRLLTMAPYMYGQLLNFEIRVFNQGNQTASNIVVKDFIPNGYTYVSNNGWTGTFPNLQNIIAGPVAPGDSAVIYLELTLIPSNNGGFVNYAEIAGADGPSGPGFDADSNPDSDSVTERSVLPGDADDDNILGGGPNAGEDEDDHDPAGPSIFDLALRKTVETALPSYSYGQDVMYRIEVFNQGSVAARDIIIRDTIPCGFSFDAMNPSNFGWSQTGSIITYTISSVLNPGQSIPVFVNYIVQPCYTDPATAWTNYAEIGSAINDETGLPGDDIDSSPDNNMDNDSGGVPDFNGVNSGTDNTINNENGDEDDHDPHKIQVFDLALRKQLITAGPYSYGQTLTFHVEVYNQGNVAAQNILISDYLPNGYSFVPNNGWTVAAPGRLVNTYTGILQPDEVTTLVLELTLQPGTSMNSWNNYAEVSAAQDDQGNNRNDDADSVYDTTPGNDNPVLPGDSDDDNLLGNGPNVGEDEDDHDVAAPAIVDIAMSKTVTTAGPYSYGQTVSYDIVISNEGNVPLSNIVVKDSLPCGMIYDGGSQPWTVVGNEATTTYTGTIAPFASATVSISVILQECYTDPATAWTNIAQIVSMEDDNGDDVSDDDVDSDPDNDDPNDDDQDDETLAVFDLALRKQLITAGPYSYGQSITFAVEIHNQGNLVAENIVISDYLPDGYSFVPNNGWTLASPGRLENTITSELAPGASTTINLTLTLQTGTSGTSWTNYSEVTVAQDTSGMTWTTDADSNPDSNPNNDNPVLPGDSDDDNILGNGPNTGEDEDDHDVATPAIVDIAMSKTVTTAGPYSYGQTVSYDIVISNEGNVPLSNIVVKDSLPCGMIYDGGSQPWTVVGNEATTTYTGTVAPFASATISISVTLQACYTDPATAWTNIAQIVSMEDDNGDDVSDDDVDSDPDNDDPNDDDQDDETLEIFDLALRKRLLTTAPYMYGQLLNFEIRVFNQGNQTASNIVVKDFIPNGYTYVSNNGWTGTFPNLQNIIAGPIAPGDSAVIYLELTLIPSNSGGFVNYAEIAGADGPSGPGFDADSNPDSDSVTERSVLPGDADDDNILGGGPNVGEDEDDHDPAGPSIFDLALRKTVETALPSYSYGQDVMYRIEVFNQGSVAARDIIIRDTIPCGFSFDAMNPSNVGWSQTGSIITYTISSVLNPGQSIPVFVNYVVQPCYTDPATAWTNYAEIGSAINDETGLPGDDIDSSPDNNMDNDSGGVPDFNGVSSGTDNTINNENGDEDDHDPHKIQVFDLALRKQLITAGPYSYGQTLTFHVEVYNQGNVAAQNILISDYLPNGYSFVPNNGWTVAAPGRLENTYAGILQPDEVTTLVLELTLQPGTTMTSWNNYAEISGAQDDQGVNRNDDADSVYDTTPGNDNPVLPGDSDDDNLLGNGPNVGEDEDDHDVAAPAIIDIAMSKTVTTAGPYSYGQTVSYDIVISNEGNVPLSNIVVKDSLPCGMIYDGGSQPWTVIGNEATTTYTGTIAPFASATVSISVILQACYTDPATAWTNIAQIVSMEDDNGDDVSDDDVDSDPDNDDPNNDDQDDETLAVFDLALRKQLITAGPYSYGQSITFSVEVHNQGNLVAENIVISDYLPDGYSFVPNNGWTLASPGRLENTITSELAPGASTTLNLTLTLQTGTSGTSWTNYSEVTVAQDTSGMTWTTDADSNPDSDPNNDNPVLPGDSDDDNILGNGPNTGEDEDDHDVAAPEIVDIAMSKTVITAGPYSYGQTVSYDIVISNEGNVPLTNIVVKDSLPCGMIYDGGSQPWTVVGNEATTTYTGTIAPFASATVSISVTLQECYTDPATAWTNIAQIVSMEDDNGDDVSDDDVDSDPDNDDPNDDDQDDETLEVFDLALRKQLITAGPYSYGQSITFAVEVHNQGNLVAENIVISDYLPDGYSFVPNNGWTLASPGRLENTITSELAPGASTTLNLTLTLQTGTSGTSWTNYSEVTVAQDTSGMTWTTDADSNPDSDPNNDNPVLPGDSDDDNILGNGPNAGEDEDDHDVAAPAIVDIAMSKTVTTAGPYSYGQTVSYNIVISNEGNVPLTNIVVKDILPCGMIYAGGSQPWTVSGNEATTTYTGTIAPFASATISISVTLQACYTDPASAWTNIASIISMENDEGDDVSDDDVDSDPDNDDPNDDDQDDETLEVFDLALTKRLVTTPPYSYGQTHTFEIEIYNQGNTPASNIVIYDYIPDGYGFSANNGWTGVAPLIQQTIAGPIQPGQSLIVNLNLTLQQSSEGARAWINYAEIVSGETPTGPGFDADSNPNSNSPSEQSVEPGGPDDDNITGGGSNVGEDEDDHDPAGPQIFDLALTKVATTAAPSYSYGQTVTYEIEVYNQGNVAAGSIQISDYLPCGLTFNPGSANNALWSLASANRLTIDLNYILNPGQSTTVLLDLQVRDCYTNPSTAWTNIAEITAATDVSTGVQGLDIDSSPDNIAGNDNGGVPDFNGVLSGTDNTIGNENGDEDDQDPHKIQVFDLALRKVVTDRGPYMLGETATFQITIFNQGNVPATNIVINDYIRSGFTFPANPGWTLVTAPMPSSDGLLQYVYAGTLQPGQSALIPLQLTVALDANPAVTDWYNYAEIQSSQDDQDNNRDDDADSTPDSDSPYENQVVPDGPWDNVIDGNGPFANEDEDDHDPDYVLVVGGLGDTVWKDVNGNGIQDPGEPGVRNVIVRLQDCAGNTLQTAVTDANGFYFFNNVFPGDYRVRFDISGQAPGCLFTLQDQGGDDETDSDVDIYGIGPCIYVQAGVYDSTYDAGLLFLAAIGDRVWHDLNVDGIQNAGEPGIPNVRVELYRADGTLYGVTFTDAAGNYLFDFLYPGDYYVKFGTPNGFIPTLVNIGNDASDNDVDGSNGPGTTATTTLISGERDMTWDAGFYTCVQVGEVVWYDFNRNDIRDLNENGINGLDVRIYRRVGNSWQLFETTTTGPKPGTPSDDGYWKFCVPPGTYYVQIDMPPLGLVRVRPNVGGNPNRDSDLTNANGPMTTNSFTVTSGQMKCDIGAGFYPMAVTGNLVWVDENLNGIQEYTEPVVEGVIVRAKDAITHETVKTSVTDHNGQYELDYLESGDVYLAFELPAAYNQYVPTVARNGADHEDSDVDGSYGQRTTRMFTIESAMTNMDIDFGIVYGPLPVQWLNIFAINKGDYHLVSWSTAREINSDYFVVERKREGENSFVQLSGLVKAAGYTSSVRNYSFNDVGVEKSGTYIYRIKQVDFDGKVSYSNEVSLIRSEIRKAGLYPNPAKDFTTLQMDLPSETQCALNLYDANGILVKTILQQKTFGKGHYEELISLEDLPSGMYNCVIDFEGEQIKQKLVIID